MRRWKSRRKNKTILLEEPRTDFLDGFDSHSIRATSPDGTALLLTIRKLCGRRPQAEVSLHVQLPDGVIYKLPSK